MQRVKIKFNKEVEILKKTQTEIILEMKKFNKLNKRLSGKLLQSLGGGNVEESVHSVRGNNNFLKKQINNNQKKKNLGPTTWPSD